MNKIETIRCLMASGRSKEVLGLVEGVSDWPLEREQAQDARRLRILVVHHLRFVSEFGSSSSGCYKGKRYLTPFPQDFEQWLLSGAPEVLLEDLEALLVDHPL
ncbi:hypothetical protein [Pseudomonas gingeri]|uniref:Uncharacterized protein n=1 Tax=Pseudomonas gingeri TaxID=117681 RepID=A0A7Y8CP40_9PSED|nr:hypothetical protein [Pseudomonas gingeri]NVZ30005.1 hypothetical protein [Pseudomonas gingeri]NWB32040.1 hypothetical protein [Pseudomonas gingeri]NWC37520.1 hypothetical protein [Pseudomonas gingeri]NWD53063.1 hypothetical protein [Pseudomonas gingeri]